MWLGKYNLKFEPKHKNRHGIKLIWPVSQMMEKMIWYFRYGSVKDYLVSIGFSEEEQEELRTNLLEHWPSHLRMNIQEQI